MDEFFTRKMKMERKDQDDTQVKFYPWVVVTLCFWEWMVQFHHDGDGKVLPWQSYGGTYRIGREKSRQ